MLGVAETAEEASDTLSEVLRLKSKLEDKVNQNFGRKTNSANILLNHLFKHPIVDVREVQKTTKLSFKAANDLVNDFIKAKMLKETTGQSRNRLFSFDDYLKLFIR